MVAKWNAIKSVTRTYFQQIVNMQVSHTTTDQLEASLAGENDLGTVVLTGVRCTLGGAEVGDGHLSCGAVNDRPTGSPANVLSFTANGQTHSWLFHLQLREPHLPMEDRSQGPNRR